MSSSRFVSVNEEKLKKLTEQKNAKNTQRTNVYASIRSKTGGGLKTSTLQNVKHGLTKYLKETCHINVRNDCVVSSSNKIFKAVVTDLKKGTRIHRTQANNFRH
ncbi:hypothetical protein KUTeg_017760 [Tegillarca granosa]|uniref:Uncharacterized protein n=1 Tax=Tegillarca granosa TaxID=220873 RepID=A0ABQ9EFV4_TEGGR|nr:hypothetical protein KUTeg_017760 [Tegillarca granosa]